MNKHVNQMNYFAIELLEKLGNIEPTEFQIEVMESILLQVVPHRKIFNKELTLVEVIAILLAAKSKITGKIARLLNVDQIDIEGHYTEIKNKLGSSVLATTIF
jgi:hypothetical protein